MPVHDVSFYAAAWRQARQDAPSARRQCRSEEDMITHWSRRAARFAGQTGGVKDGGGYQEVLRFLINEGALQSGLSVLDIGAGSGNLTLPMAEMGAWVTVLEPAAGMRDLLRQRAVAKKLSNITYLDHRWQDIDLTRDGLAQQFDLVVASMTPGVQDPLGLEAMMAASRRFCYYSAFSCERWDQAQRDLWRVFFAGEELTGNPGDIIYAFNYLYALGYRPVLRFAFEKRVREAGCCDAVEELAEFFWQYIDISREVRATIKEYVIGHAVKGRFRRESRICRGMMLWRVDQNIHKE